jgi:predicted small secreted protein
MKKTIVVSIMSLFLTACSSLQGVVRDKDTGSPIPSAYITVNRDSGTTNGLGHYELVGAFIPGDTMMVNAPGYNIYTQTIKTTNEIIDIDLTKK